MKRQVRIEEEEEPRQVDPSEEAGYRARSATEEPFAIHWDHSTGRPRGLDAARLRPERPRSATLARAMAALDARGKVLEVQALPLRHFLLRIRVAGMAPAAPGQFVMVAGANQAEPYLRRAFSVYDQAPAGNGALAISLLGKVIGRGTENLAACTPGQDIPVLGPLGTGFHSMASDPPRGGRAALVAGGIGSAGLGLLAQALARAGRPFDFYYGGRSADDLVEAGEFRRLSESTGGRLVRTTEDGTAGGRGVGH